MSLIADSYYGSDGRLTLQAVDALLSAGPNGELAALLFRAMKASARAKRYRGHAADGRSYRSLSYERKAESLRALCDFLDGSDASVWGWGADSAQSFNRHVLYIELPTGQVSFHSPRRFAGPTFAGAWDREHKSEERILQFCEDVVLDEQEERIVLVCKALAVEQEQAEGAK